MSTRAAKSAPLLCWLALAADCGARATSSVEVPTTHGGGAGVATAGIAWLGRTVAVEAASPAHVRLSWPGVGLAIRFEGTGVDADMRDDVRLYAGRQLESHWDVVVDGGAATTFSVGTTRKTIALAADLAAGPHELWLRKRTEASLGATEIFGLAVAGGNLLPPPALPGRRIEVVGASIETGYGIGGVEGVSCSGFAAAQQDQGQAWPQLLADTLGAQLMNTSYSGKGMASNIDISLDPVNTMPKVARLAEPTDFAHVWDPNGWVPDVVAIAMGSNDWEGLGGESFDPNRLIAAYVAFVEARLVEAPGATVYATISPQIYAQERSDVGGAVREVVAQLRADGHDRVHVLEFPEYDGAAKSCDGHPPPALHAAMAARLAAQIRQDVGW